MDLPDRCACRNFSRAPGRGCHQCDPPTADENAARKAAAEAAEAAAIAGSIRDVLEVWNGGNGPTRCVNPTTVRVGDYDIAFGLGGIGLLGDISSADHPELNVMVTDLMARYEGRLARELY